MIVEVNTTEFLKSFQEYMKVVERKLNHVARGFSYQIAQTAMNHTPLGDARQSKDMMAQYLRRQNTTGLNPQEGFARGSWQVKKNTNFTIQEFYGVSSGSQALTVVSTELESMTIKDDFYIGNRGYYIKALEGNWSKQTNGLGIKKPTLDTVLAAYSISIKQLYNEG